MGRPLVKLLLWVFIVLVQNHGLEGCLEEERIGLLKLKAFFTLNNGDETSHLLLPSWVDERESECCDWERVSCNHTTGRVVELNLDNLMQYKSYYQFYPYCLNVSLFKPFDELLSLDISWNGLDCYVENEGFERLSKLERLEILNVALNSFNNSILKSLGSLTSLKTLNVSHNRLEGPRALQELSTLRKLEKMDLSWNYINASLPAQGYQTLSKLSKLEHLDLSFNNFNKDILKYLGNLPILKFLSLEFSQMKGPLSNKELANLNNLEVLILSGNQLNGTLPIQDLISFKNLEVLDLSDNKFTGNIPPHIGAMTSLKALALSLDLSCNNLTGEIPSELGRLVWIHALNLSHNQLKGSIPKTFSSLIQLESLDLSYNKLSGLIPLELISFKNLEVLDLSDNKFTGNIPPHIGAMTSLKALALSLDLSCNNLTGEIPSELGRLVWIHALNLSHNQLKGSIPKTFSSLIQLESLDLSYNKLSGLIPLELIDLHFLAVFSVAHNNLSGKIPDMKAQFGTFDESSYEGNPYLCGALLEKNCTTIVQSPIDLEDFYVTFSVSYIMFLSTLASILAINPYWRRRWFNFIEDHIYSSYYFVYDGFYKLLAR